MRIRCKPFKGGLWMAVGEGFTFPMCIGATPCQAAKLWMRAYSLGMAV